MSEFAIIASAVYCTFPGSTPYLVSVILRLLKIINVLTRTRSITYNNNAVAVLVYTSCLLVQYNNIFTKFL